jgi:hypothetical protein
MDRFTAAERTVSQRDTHVLDRLLHDHADIADDTRSGRFGNGDGDITEVVRLLAIPVVEGMDFRSQRFKRRERERAVFFRS